VDEKIKIARIITRLNIGGPAIHVVLLTEGLDKARFESLLISGKISMDEGDMSYYAFDKGVRPVFIPELRRELGFLSDSVAAIKILRILIKEKPKIIHTHTAKAGALGRFAGIIYNFLNILNKKRQAKLFHTFHGHIFSGYFSKIKTEIFIQIERFLALFTAKIITVSESVKHELSRLKICTESKILVIPLGLELEKFLKIPLEKKLSPNIGIVGRLVPVKNHRLFLEAAAKMAEENQDIELKFKVIGGGELREGLVEYARKLNIYDKVEFLGWRKKIEEIYVDLGIVVLTSNNEGTPVSLIEAMASGKIIVSSGVGGVKDLLGRELNDYRNIASDFVVLERGVMVKRQDPSCFANAMDFVLKSHKLRQEIALSARLYAGRAFAKERLIKDIEKAYS